MKNLNKSLLISALILCVLCGCKPFNRINARASTSTTNQQTKPTAVVELPCGKITGEELISGVKVYKGIPYAESPIGNLRWKPPVPITHWDGVKNCVKFGDSCPQPQSTLGGDSGKQSEDCLYLNVWTAAKSSNAKLPVMVWIHGGGCVTGSGSKMIYDGAHFAQNGVVLVTINYRLGPFGFLAHPELSKESPNNVSGNYGMLDQITALKWVKRNIAVLGGDPNNITIFGESAGSGSVARLLVSPLASGLFQRAILESGGGMGRNRHLKESSGALQSAITVGTDFQKKLGCSSLSEMRLKSADDLLAKSDSAVGLFDKGTKWGWIVDGWAIPEDPDQLFEKGKAVKVPVLLGFNKNEGTVFLKNLPIKGKFGFSLMLKSYYGEDSKEAEKLFWDESAGVKSSLDKLTTITSFAYPAHHIAKSMGKMGSPAYMYEFSYVPKSSKQPEMGAFHGLEIPFVFGTMKELPSADAVDIALSSAMMSYWINFAKTGNPNGGNLPFWDVYNPVNPKLMEFDATPSMNPMPFTQEFNFLDKRRQDL